MFSYEASSFLSCKISIFGTPTSDIWRAINAYSEILMKNIELKVLMVPWNCIFFRKLRDTIWQSAYLIFETKGISYVVSTISILWNLKTNAVWRSFADETKFYFTISYELEKVPNTHWWETLTDMLPPTFWTSRSGGRSMQLLPRNPVIFISSTSP